MEIITKYNIGNKVWFWENNEKTCAKVVRIAITVEKDKRSNKLTILNSYFLDCFTWRDEQFLFKTKEEL